MRYTRYSTANDVMKEFLIYGAELTDMGFPILPAVNCSPSETIDFFSPYPWGPGNKKHRRKSNPAQWLQRAYFSIISKQRFISSRP